MTSVFDKPETLLSINKADVLVYVDLSRRDKCINTKELMTKQKYSNSSSYLNTKYEFKASIIALYDELKFNFDEFMLNNHKDKYLRYHELSKMFEQIDVADEILFEAFAILDFHLYKTNVTKQLIRKVVDTRSPRATDEAQGLW